MKLRKKKTGAIVECEGIVFTHCNALALTWEQYSPNVNSLAELNKEWEDYKPKEPLIKDEKIRKAVRAFSEAIQEKKHILVIKECGRGRAEFSNGANYWIRLPLDVETMDALEDRTYYTIAELCGEEENDTSEQKD